MLYRETRDLEQEREFGYKDLGKYIGFGRWDGKHCDSVKYLVLSLNHSLCTMWMERWVFKGTLGNDVIHTGAYFHGRLPPSLRLFDCH